MIAFYICSIVMYLQPTIAQYVLTLGLAIIGVAALESHNESKRSK